MGSKSSEVKGGGEARKEGGSEAVEKKRVIGRPFEKGKVTCWNGKKKPKPQVGEDMAADMRLAYTTAEKPDDPPGVKHARILLHENYERFMMLYARVAPPLAKVASDASKEAASEGTKIGPKEEKVAGMVSAMLSEFGSRSGCG